jgi:WD40 repeat protein
VLAGSVLLGSSIFGVALATNPASAETQAQLPITTFGDIAVDGAHQRIFMSDYASGKIIATDYAGKVVGTAEGLPNVSEIALSDDNSRLYATQSTNHAIVALATDTLAETARYQVGSEVYPGSVNPAGGKIWFGYGIGDDANFGAIDSADSSVWLYDGPDANRFDATPYVISSPAAPGKLLVTANKYSSAGGATLYDVSSGTAVQEVQIPSPSSPGYEWTFTPDGSRVVEVGRGAEQQLDADDLTTVATYPAYDRANAVDINTDGRVAISVGNKATGDDIYVFDGNSTVASQTIRTPEAASPYIDGSGELSRDGIQDQGIAWEPGGARLFAVGRYNRAFRLWVFNGPEAPKQTTLTMSGNNAVYAYGQTVTFTAKLGPTDTNRTLEIWADPTGADQPSRVIKKGTVNGAGVLTATFRLTRNTTVGVRFAGDAKYAAKGASSVVYTRVAVGTSVSKAYKTGKIGSTKYSFFHKKTTPTFTTSMTYFPGRKQKLTVQHYSKGAWKNWKTVYVAVNASGRSVAGMTGSHPLNGRFRVQAAYVRGSSGDSANYTTYGTWQYFTFRK